VRHLVVVVMVSAVHHVVGFPRALPVIVAHGPELPSSSTAIPT
jgi:hypothetical protein